MTESSSGRTVLVTGGAGGMAVGITARLAAAGHTVLVADLDLDASRAVASRIEGEGGVARGYALDVTSDESVARLHDDVTRDLGAIDALVNAAGILDRKYLSDHDTASFQRALDVNLVGAFRTIKAFGPDMRARGWGRIVNISSIAGVTGYPYPSYAASKAGLSNLTRSLLVDFWGSGVTVNSVCPGVVDTSMVVQEVRDQVENKVPTQQMVTPDEIGALIAFLLTDDARSINGADLLIDGGATRVFRLLDDVPN